MRKPPDAGKHTGGNLGNGLNEFSEREMMNLNMLTDEELLRHVYTLDPLVQSDLERELMARLASMLDGERDEVQDLTRDVENLESEVKLLKERIGELEKENDDQAEEVLRLERELDAVGTS